jgi:hypothetical protein
MRSVTDEVLEIVREMPGVTSGQIVELMPHITKKQSVYAALNSQYLRGVIARDTVPPEGKGRPAFAWKMNPDPAQKPPVRSVSSATSQKIVDTTVTSLRAQIAELEAWKADAIGRYPDLAVDAIVLKARSIVAAELHDGGDFVGSEAVLAGHRDTVLRYYVADAPSYG